MQEKIDIKDNVGLKVTRGPESDIKDEPESTDAEVEFDLKLKMKNALYVFLCSTAKKANVSLANLIAGLALDAARIHMLFPPEEMMEIIKLKQEEQRLLKEHYESKKKNALKAEDKKKSKRKIQKESRKKNR